MRVSRRRALLVAVAVAVATTAVGLGATRMIKSPQQMMAEAEPPPPTVITAPVERRVLSKTVVLRGEVRASRSYEVTPSPVGQSAPIVTRINVEQGSILKPGQVVLEVGGRPLIAFAGARPAYRDLRPGYEGPDVGQLQETLRDLGYGIDDDAGWFGGDTKRALTSYYRSLGYEPEPTSPDDDSQIAGARSQVVAAERAVDDARDALKAGSEQDRRSLEKALRRAREDLATAQDARDAIIVKTGPTLPLAEYVYLPSFPARVDGLKATVGAKVVEPLVTLSSGALQVQGTLGPGDQALVKPGMRAEIVSETIGDVYRGEVTTVGDLVVDDQDPSRTGYPITISTNDPIPATMAGLNVRMTVTTASSSGEVLAVPVAALVSGADGGVYVIVRDGDGVERRTAVRLGLTGGGYVAVQSDDLHPGDQVVLGVDR